MSYILDALRKSDQQRQRGAAPTLTTVQATTEEMRRPRLLVYGLLAVFMAVSGGVIGWFRPWQAPLPPASGAVVKLGDVHANEPVVVSLSSPGHPPDLPAISRPKPPAPVITPHQAQLLQRSERTIPAPVRKNVPPELPPPAPAQTVSTPLRAVATVGREGFPTATENTADAEVPEVVQASGVVAISELPLAIQREIPTMSVQVHAYSDMPAERMVGINDLLLKEGDLLVPGLKLEQITPDGMVFGYKQYHFRHGVQ